MIAPNLYRGEELTYRQIQALDPRRSIAFLPVSALEVHGPHLPLGMDLFAARWMAEETARRFAQSHPDWTVVLYPPLTIGTDELPLPGSVDGTQQTLYRAVTAYGSALAKAGFGYLVVTNGHGGPRHASALEAACRSVSRKRGISMFTPSIAVLHGIVSGRRFEQVEAALGRPLTPQERQGLLSGEHAATMETSFMLAAKAELVDPAYRELPPDAPPPFRPFAFLGRRIASLLKRRDDPEQEQKLNEIVDSLAGGIGWLLNAHYGYGGHQVTYQGHPAVASAELGHALREVMAAACLDIVEQVVQGQLPATDVRSIASDPIIIQPGFWQRLALAAAAIAVLAVWLRRR